MIIRARYNGPPGSGNGGYMAGLVAKQLGWAVLTGAEVTLRRPPPLDTPFDLRQQPDGSTGVYAGEELIAFGHASAVTDEPVEPVRRDRAAEAATTFRGFAAHPFPTCYVCGPGRDDGLGIFPGRIGSALTAAPFVVPPDVSPVVIWASLDCPGGWAVPQEQRAYVLGRMAARIDALPQPGDECVVVGLLVGEEGRKAHVRTSLYAPDGALLATARATWVALAAE